MGTLLFPFTRSDDRLKEVCQDGSQVQPMEEGARQDEVEVEEEETAQASEKEKEDETEEQVSSSSGRGAAERSCACPPGRSLSSRVGETAGSISSVLSRGAI